MERPLGEAAKGSFSVLSCYLALPLGSLKLNTGQTLAHYEIIRILGKEDDVSGDISSQFFY